jgi:hypothetical protein
MMNPNQEVTAVSILCILFRIWMVCTGVWATLLFTLCGSAELFMENMKLVAYPPLVVLAIGAALGWAVAG